MRFALIAMLMLGSMELNLAAQKASPVSTNNVTCTFEDGKQITLRYKSVPASNNLESGKPLMPGGSPMLLFSRAKMSAADSELPPGAFSVYIVPQTKGKWSLVINRNVSADSKYDPTQDIVRLPMDVGKVGTEMKSFTPVLVHAAPKQCNVRIYEGKQLAWWAGFKESE
ncbi:MAG TPA: DUF2911 domain-containing protein [Ktedonobacteraceae bacterium]